MLERAGEIERGVSEERRLSPHQNRKASARRGWNLTGAINSVTSDEISFGNPGFTLDRSKHIYTVAFQGFTRLTNGHSKKIDNHVHMVALYTTWYNFARINSAVRMSPAMACGLEQRLWDIADIVNLIEQAETAEAA